MLTNRQHLAALLPIGPALVLELMRWGPELRSPDALSLPPEGAAANGLKPAEMTMAQQLIEQMTTEFKPGDWRDSFSDDIRALVERKARSGDVEWVDDGAQPAAADGGAEVIDLSDLLRRSLGKNAGTPTKASPTRAVPAAKKAGKTGAGAKKAAPRKVARKAA